MTKKTQQQISYNMSRIRNKDSEIEILLRKELWRRGLRYRKNVKSVIGKPDIVFISKKVAIFCDSEFWHGFNWEERKQDFKTNEGFWISKIERNIQRDIDVSEQLRKQGWNVQRYWGEYIKKNLIECANIIERTVRGE